METNNKIQLFSTTTNNVYSDTDMQDSAVQTIVKTGAVFNKSASSKLYNSLSKSLSLPVVALVDYVAKQNPTITFGQALDIDSWISAFQNSFAPFKTTQDSISAINTNITNITKGTTAVGKATNVTTNINGKAISTIFETNGTTAKNSTNATNVTSTINGKKITDIFMTDGITVKKSNEADHSLIAYSSIQVRLTENSARYGDFTCDLRTDYVVKRPDERLKATGFSNYASDPNGTRDIYSCISIWDGEITKGQETSAFSVNLRNGDEIEIEWSNSSNVSHQITRIRVFTDSVTYYNFDWTEMRGSNSTNGKSLNCRATLQITKTKLSINSDIVAYDSIKQGFDNTASLTIYRVSKVYKNYMTE